jgi:hypothetical protein
LQHAFKRKGRQRAAYHLDFFGDMAGLNAGEFAEE